MTPSEAIQDIRTRSLAISQQITAIHPLIPHLKHEPTQSEILRALFELTRQVEVLKKHLLKLEKGDGASVV
ncbi:MAG: hypothetical protein KIT22_01800 [Verrucomicrobiae bacterium]|nr:hypothetical protein [Verrucomicrobiae bacterium]